MPKIIETLQQDVWWYGQDSMPYRVARMDTEHIGNVLEFLRRRASQLKLQHYWDEFLEYNDLLDDEIGPESERAFIQWLGANPAIEADPHGWLEQTPLVKALKYELVLRNTVDGDVVGVHTEEELEDGAAAHNRAVGTDQGFRGRPALG